MARPDVNGIETFYYSDRRSARLAAHLQQQMLNVSPGSPNRGVKRGRFFVIRRTTMPAALIEMGFVTGNIDSPRLASSVHRRRLALAIANGILDYLKGVR
jgi:N-acetylmuramoyl-L-alanine amidase